MSADRDKPRQHEPSPPPAPSASNSAQTGSRRSRRGGSPAPKPQAPGYRTALRLSSQDSNVRQTPGTQNDLSPAPGLRDEDRLLMAIDPETREALRLGDTPKE